MSLAMMHATRIAAIVSRLEIITTLSLSLSLSFSSQPIVLFTRELLLAFVVIPKT